MAQSRYKFYDTVFNVDYQHEAKGFPSENIGDLFKSSNDILYTIPIEEQYRPDLIAKRFFGDPTLSWILIFINNFANSPEDFISQIIIRVPRFETVIGLV